MLRLLPATLVATALAELPQNIKELDFSQFDFDALADHLNVNLQNDYTPQELDQFRRTFDEHKSEVLANGKNFTEVFWGAEPVATDKKLRDFDAEIPKGEDGKPLWWTEKSPRFDGWSVRDAKVGKGFFRCFECCGNYVFTFLHFWVTENILSIIVPFNAHKNI